MGWILTLLTRKGEVLGGALRREGLWEGAGALHLQLQLSQPRGAMRHVLLRGHGGAGGDAGDVRGG